MNKIANNQAVKKIIMKPIAHTCCEIGGDWYQNKLFIEFIPGGYYPDYMDVNKWIMDNIDGKVLNIEDVAGKVKDMLIAEYYPESVRVIDTVENCKTHFDVIVEV